MTDIHALNRPAPRPIAISNWLFAVAAMIFVMVVVGGITRLTESGLSIVEGKPITGAIPPLTEQAWQDAFDGCKKIPEYTELNRGMTLEAFKHIYFYSMVSFGKLGLSRRAVSGNYQIQSRILLFIHWK